MADADATRARLEAELRRALQRAGANERAVASVMAAGCRLDGVGAGAVRRELAEADARLTRRVRETAAALDRLERGEYGRCEQCGAVIDPERLELLPGATRCRACAREEPGLSGE